MKEVSDNYFWTKSPPDKLSVPWTKGWHTVQNPRSSLFPERTQWKEGNRGPPFVPSTAVAEKGETKDKETFLTLSKDRSIPTQQEVIKVP